jgi:hypothetical protein
MKPITEPSLSGIRLIRHFIYQQLMDTICKLITYLIMPPTCLISGFRREVDENCALLGCYAASSGDFLPTFREYKMKPAALNGVYTGKSVKIK